MTQIQDKPATRQGRRRKAAWVAAITCGALLIAAAIPVALIMRSGRAVADRQPIRYLGLYERGTPFSYTGVSAFTTATHVTPNMVMYYSPWQEPFQTSFATAAADHHAVPLVQMNPSGISLAAVASGQYDAYLITFAKAVRAYRHPVILSLGHEMNGRWYSWGYTHTSPAVFISAWRHVVDLFRGLGVQNATWLWTVNIIDVAGGIASPAPWWPGRSYVNWVGIDGYYYSPSQTFSSLFGPTITAIREITGQPILIAETAVSSAADQPAQINDLFAGIRLYGLLGFVWFSVQDWRLSSDKAIAAFRQGATGYLRPAS